MSNVNETAVQEIAQPVENVQEQTQTESNISSVENKKESSVPPPANLIPAPIPTSSPWKSVSNDIPITSISVEDFESLKKKSPTPSIKSHTSTKWVPIKASITVSNNNNKNGNKNKNHRHTHNGKKNSNSNKTKQNHSKKNKKNSNQNKKQEKAGEGDSSQPVSSSNENTSSSTTATTSTVDEKNTSTEINDSDTSIKASGEQPQQPQQQHSHSNNNKQKRFNNKHHSHHFNNNNNRKFYNKQQQGQGQQPQGQTQNGFTPRQNNSNSNFRHSNNNQKHRSFRPQQMAQLYSMLYPFHYSMMAVNSVARQIEYYLSDENFATDDYLKQQLSKDGYVPLSLLSKFYRLLNMSFGGDLNIIMAALREIVFNENATVEVVQGEQIINPAEESNQEQNEEEERRQDQEEEQGEQESEKKSVTEPSPLTKYFIRSKNWEKWLPETPTFEVEIHKTLSGNDLDEFMLKMVTVPQHHNHHSHRNHRNYRMHQQQKSEEKDDQNSATESNESTNEATPADESGEYSAEQDNASASTTDVEKSIPIEDNSKEGSVPVEVDQSS